MPDRTHAANRVGIAAMSLGMASFIANDGLVKYVSQSLPAAQLICIRGLFATVLLLVLARAMGQLRSATADGASLARQLLRGPVMARSVIDAFASMAYLTALFHLPIGNATAINMSTPLFLSVYAALVWGERIGPGRWLLIASGFAGVLLIVQPSADGFNAWALLCLLATLMHALRDVITRTIPRQVPSLLITLATAVAVTLVSGGFCLAGSGWQPVTPRHLALLAAASVFLSGGYYLIIMAMREGDVSLIAPFRYSALLYALLIGWFVWGDIPNALAWSGIALLVGAGLLMLRGNGRR